MKAQGYHQVVLISGAPWYMVPKRACRAYRQRGWSADAHFQNCFNPVHAILTCAAEVGTCHPSSSQRHPRCQRGRQADYLPARRAKRCQSRAAREATPSNGSLLRLGWYVLRRVQVGCMRNGREHGVGGHMQEIGLVQFGVALPC